MQEVRFAASALLLTATLMSTIVTGADQAQDAPTDSGLTEEVQVQLRLVDFLVLDKQNRTVPNLGLEEFKLSVGGTKLPIATLDTECPVGLADEPASGSSGLPSQATSEPRRIILVFDYFHIDNVAETIDRALEMLDRLPVGGEEHMLISVGRNVRVEAPLTTDLGDIRWALQRMRNDPTLYAEYQSSLTNYPFFERLKALFDLVGQWEGRKSIVLFSGPFRPDEFFHDPQHRELSGLAASLRTSVYPVDVGGLRTPGDPKLTPLGGPGELRRVANETGGRMTSDTNDISVAYARAHRDLGCTYTLGFYDEKMRVDRKSRLKIKIKGRKDLRIVYPEFYLQRSDTEKRESLFNTALLAPHMFESTEIETDLFVMGPGSPSRWRAVMVVEVQLDGAVVDAPDAKWELKGFLRKPNGTIVHAFKHSIPLPTPDPKTGTVNLTVFEPMNVDPGRYVVSAVFTEASSQTPRAATRSIELVAVPFGTPFLLGPILGHSAPASSDNGKGAPTFEPLIETRTEPGAPLRALTLACVVGSKEPIGLRDITRRVLRLDGTQVESFNTSSIELPGGGKAFCHELLDSIETSGLPVGPYEIDARAVADGLQIEGSAAELILQHRAGVK